MQKITATSNFRKNQDGLVAFIVTLLIMIILSMIIIGFSVLTRRDQRQAVDRQLQTQAFYAAESGVNDASKILVDNPGLADKTSCDNSSAPWSNMRPALNSDGSIGYTCVLVSTEVATIEFDEVGNNSKVTPIRYANNSQIGQINIEWQNSDESVPVDVLDCDGNSSEPKYFTELNGWQCSVGIMRVDLVPVAGGMNRDSLLNNLMTVFLYPVRNGAGTVAYNNVLANQGNIVSANCLDSGVCNATITGLASTEYMLRLRGVYESSRVIVRPVAPNRFKGAQAIIDATGKAQDIVRRIQVRKSIGTINSSLLADYAIEAEDICKRYTHIPGVNLSSNECPAL